MRLPGVSLLRDSDENITVKEEDLVIKKKKRKEEKDFLKKTAKREGLDATDAVNANALLCSLVLISMRKSDG